MTDLVKQIEYCHATWEACPRQEWVHQFIHTLDLIPRNSYILVELRHGIVEWDELDASFTHTIEFVDDHPSIDVALQVIKTDI